MGNMVSPFNQRDYIEFTEFRNYSSKVLSINLVLIPALLIKSTSSRMTPLNHGLGS